MQDVVVLIDLPAASNEERDAIEHRLSLERHFNGMALPVGTWLRRSADPPGTTCDLVVAELRRLGVRTRVFVLPIDPNLAPAYHVAGGAQ